MSSARQIQRAAAQRAAARKKADTRGERREAGLRRLAEKREREAKAIAEQERRDALAPEEREAEDDAARERLRGHPLYAAATLGVMAALGTMR